MKQAPAPSAPAGSVLSISELGMEETLAIMREATSSPRLMLNSLASRRLVVALIMNRSLRTRLGLARACVSTGAEFLELDPERIYAPSLGNDARPYKNESLADIVRVVNLHASCFAIRAYGPSTAIPLGGGDDLLEQVAATASIPILNLESDSAHPIQALADLATIASLGPMASRHVALAWAYSPEPKPLAVPSSLAMAVAASGARLTIVSPPEFRLPTRVTDDARKWAEAAGGSLTETTDLMEGTADADVLYMKSWLSTETEHAKHSEVVEPYANWRATDKLLGALPPRARYMHCLPADRGYEVDDAVIDGEQSMVWVQVEMRREVTHILLKRALARENGGFDG